MKRSLCSNSIIFVGDEHNTKNFQKKIAFVGSKSYKKLLDWVYQLDLQTNQVDFVNQCNIDDATELMHDHIKIVALGNKAARHCDRLGLQFFKMPHPSGCNRILNDKVIEKKLLQECYKWIRA